MEHTQLVGILKLHNRLQVSNLLHDVPLPGTAE